MKTRFRRSLGFATLLVFFLSAASCRKKISGPDAPWAVILDEVASDSAGRKVLEEWVQKFPDLDGSSIRMEKENGFQRIYVLSPLVKNRFEAESLRTRLFKEFPARYEIVNITERSFLLPADDSIPNSPAGADEFARVLSALPNPGRDRLTSFFVKPNEEKMDHPRQTWFSPIEKLGWRSMAYASYRSEDAENGTVKVLVLWPKKDGRDPMLEVYRILKQPAFPVDKPKKKVRDNASALKKKAVQNKNKKRITLEPKPTTAPIVAGEDVPLVPVGDLLPEPKSMLMPWGMAPVYVVENVAAQVVYLAWTPREESIYLVLWDNGNLVSRLLTPTGMGEMKGLSLSTAVRTFWSVLPEASAQDESLAFLEMLPFSGWSWLETKNGKGSEMPVMTAGYGSGNRAWEFSFLKTQAESEAADSFEQLFVAPRRELIQNILSTKKRKALYDVGVALKEVVDVQAWHLRGARFGKSEELYYVKGTFLCLLETKKGFLSPDELVARAASLRIWSDKKT
jgi:hypothetical protein